MYIYRSPIELYMRVVLSTRRAGKYRKKDLFIFKKKLLLT
jgi:hypothetical protein